VCTIYVLALSARAQKGRMTVAQSAARPRPKKWRKWAQSNESLALPQGHGPVQQVWKNPHYTIDTPRLSPACLEAQVLTRLDTCCLSAVLSIQHVRYHTHPVNLSQFF